MQKSKVLSTLKTEIESRIASVQAELDELLNSMANDTKSTAGDKHETSRAMAQLEQEKLGKQIEELSKFLQTFHGLSETKISDRIQPGALIETERGFFLLGIAFGQLTVDTNSVFCLSTAAPLGRLLLDKTMGDEIALNGTNFKILSLS